MIKAVLFDLDGTLLDTREGIIESVRYTITQMGYPELPNEIVLKFVGPPIQHSLMSYLGVSSEKAQVGANIFRDYYKTNALFKASVYSGIQTLLLELKALGFKLGVATYKREDYAIDILRHFGISEYFDVIHGADNENKCTKADIIQLCLKELGEDTDHVLLIGDTDYDARGAAEIGVHFVAVTWGFGFKTKTTTINYPCLAIVEYVDSLLHILRSSTL